MIRKSVANPKDYLNSNNTTKNSFPLIITSKKTNCFLLKAKNEFFLIDTGYTSERRIIEKALEKAGCTPENFNLILLTHGDFDHTANCYLFALV